MSAWTLSNLAFQRTCYLAEVIHLGATNGSPLLNEAFEAWPSGPVCRPLYTELKAFGAAPVTDILRDPILHADDEGYGSIAAAYGLMRGKNVGQMVAMTQGRDGAWDNTFRRVGAPSRGSVIPKNQMLREYRLRIGGFVTMPATFGKGPCSKAGCAEVRRAAWDVGR